MWFATNVKYLIFVGCNGYMRVTIKKKNRAVVMRTQYVENVWEGVFARCPTFIKKKVMCVCVLSRMRVSKVDVCTYR